ncbi:glucokinase [Paenibacillus taihuensis]|uniref:Glucokinase n=1 Tax=Paenibacillus taihuensis TaxID=1156355 RepID=A0A3D9Q0H1_9BACL|nr:ROK family protein [Paenibacillus taihuensis]REE56309.1 glucokinase [Paenibacillus taihuensis]
MSEYVIGVDIGGTNIRVGLLNEQFELVRKETVLTSSFGSAEQLFAGVRQLIDTIDSERRARKVGMAIPVPWREGTESIVDAGNVPCLEGVPVQTVRSFFPEHELYLDNDVNVIALLEGERGASRGTVLSMYITVSTGIGSGIVVRGEVIHGANGYAGEVGSMIVSDRDNEHSFLYAGTLESLCSGTALEVESKKLYGGDATAKTLFEKYGSKDKQAEEAIARWVEYFSRGIASLMQTLDPGMFVIGGSVIEHNPWLIEQVVESTKGKVFDNLKDRIRIAPPVFGSDAGVIGAGYTAWKRSRTC